VRKMQTDDQQKLKELSEKYNDLEKRHEEMKIRYLEICDLNNAAFQEIMKLMVTLPKLFEAGKYEEKQNAN